MCFYYRNAQKWTTFGVSRAQIGWTISHYVESRWEREGESQRKEMERWNQHNSQLPRLFPYSHALQFFIYVFHLSFVWYCRERSRLPWPGNSGFVNTVYPHPLHLSPPSFSGFCLAPLAVLVPFLFGSHFFQLCSFDMLDVVGDEATPEEIFLYMFECNAEFSATGSIIK